MSTKDNFSRVIWLSLVISDRELKKSKALT